MAESRTAATAAAGPMPPGEHEFRCELGILRGRIIVRDDLSGRLTRRGGIRKPLTREDRDRFAVPGDARQALGAGCKGSVKPL